jgi:hypothetical protein
VSSLIQKKMPRSRGRVRGFPVDIPVAFMEQERGSWNLAPIKPYNVRLDSKFGAQPLVLRRIHRLGVDGR